MGSRKVLGTAHQNLKKCGIILLRRKCAVPPAIRTKPPCGVVCVLLYLVDTANGEQATLQGGFSMGKEMTKKCTKCEKTKGLSEFSKDQNSRDGLSYRCRNCRAKHYQDNKESVKKQALEYRTANKERLAKKNAAWHAANNNQRNANLKKRYGITCDQYDDMVVAQNGLCAICGKEPDGHRPQLFVDHNHETGEVRGLLCNKCNTALGGFQDSLELLRKAVDYLS